MNKLRYDNQKCKQYSRCGHTIDLYSGNILAVFYSILSLTTLSTEFVFEFAHRVRIYIQLSTTISRSHSWFVIYYITVYVHHFILINTEPHLSFDHPFIQFGKILRDHNLLWGFITLNSLVSSATWMLCCLFLTSEHLWISLKSTSSKTGPRETQFLTSLHCENYLYSLLPDKSF